MKIWLRGPNIIFPSFFCHLRKFGQIFSFLTEQTFTHIFWEQSGKSNAFSSNWNKFCSSPRRGKNQKIRFNKCCFHFSQLGTTLIVFIADQLSFSLNMVFHLQIYLVCSIKAWLLLVQTNGRVVLEIWKIILTQALI